MNRDTILTAVFVSALFCGCSSTGPGIAGGGGEITNGICAIDGAPAPGVTVMAFAPDYIAGDTGRLPSFAITDSSGRFSFSLVKGAYTIYAFDSLSARGAFVNVVHEGVSLGVIELRKVGSITGAIVRTTANPMPIDVYIPGSPIHTTLAAPGTFTLKNVPPGDYALKIRTIDSDQCTPGLLCTGRVVMHTVDAAVLEGRPSSLGVIDITQPPP